MTRVSPPEVLAAAKRELAPLTRRLAATQDLYNRRAEIWARYVELGVTQVDLAKISRVSEGDVASAFRSRGWAPEPRR